MRARLDKDMDVHQLVYLMRQGGTQITAATVERIEAGQGSLKNAVRIANALGLRINVTIRRKLLKTS